MGVGLQPAYTQQSCLLAEVVLVYHWRVTEWGRMLNTRRRVQVLEKLAFTQRVNSAVSGSVRQPALDASIKERIVPSTGPRFVTDNDVRRLGHKAALRRNARETPTQPKVPYATQQRRMAASDARRAAAKSKAAPLNFAKSTYRQRIAAKKAMGGKAWKAGMNTWWSARRTRMAKRPAPAARQPA